jgi:hypothetical protein
VHVALEFLRGDDVQDAKLWEGLVINLTDNIDVRGWKGITSLVKDDCLLKRKR